MYKDIWEPEIVLCSSYCVPISEGPLSEGLMYVHVNLKSQEAMIHSYLVTTISTLSSQDKTSGNYRKVLMALADEEL